MLYGLSLIAILVARLWDLGAGIQYAQSRLPYSTAQRVVQATNFVGNAANSYYNQYCSSGTCSTTGLKYPRIQDLVSSGYLPSGQGYGGCNCYTTKDGSVIRLNAGSGPSGTFGMTVTPGAMLASKPAHASMVASRIPGSVLSGNMISVSQPVPALSNIASSLSGKYIHRTGVETSTAYWLSIRVDWSLGCHALSNINSTILRC